MKKILLLVGILLISSVLALNVYQNLIVTILPGGIDVYSPVQDAIYSNRMVPINLTMSTEVLRFEYFEDSEGPGTLCRRCSEYGFSKLKRKPFDDGFVQMKIVAVFEEGEVNEYRNFTVDTKDPKITKTEPNRGFTKGNFSVEFQEANPVSLILNYGDVNPGTVSKDIDLGTCYENRKNRKKCDVEVNLTDFDLQEIEYWFNITDILGNSDESKPKKIDVDVSKPIINFFNYSVDGRYVYFTFNISEENFDEINYIDNNSTNPRWKVLCSSLRNNLCEKRKGFKKGSHTVGLEVLDEAGNSVEEEIIFEII